MQCAGATSGNAQTKTNDRKTCAALWLETDSKYYRVVDKIINKEFKVLTFCFKKGQEYLLKGDK